MSKLYLIPNTLAQSFPQTLSYYQQVLPTAALELAISLKFWVAENAKTTRAVLKDIGQNYKTLQTHLQQQEMAVMDDEQAIKTLLTKAKAMSEDVGVMSEAGLPCVADPGAWVVAYARKEGFAIQAITGPCSITLGLMHSGFATQKFIFHAYLPIKAAEKQAFIQQTKQGLLRDYIHIAIETPYRNTAFLNTLVDALHAAPSANARLCVAKHLTLGSECVISEDIKKWQINNAQYLNKLNENQVFDQAPSLFLWCY
jgi:16S rRNA (cytidine1402-2'-O)-methyltransferase